MGSKIAYVFPPWYCANTHLNALDQQTAKTSAFIEVVTLAVDQLLKGIWLAAPGSSLASSYGSSQSALRFSQMAYPFWLYFC